MVLRSFVVGVLATIVAVGPSFGAEQFTDTFYDPALPAGWDTGVLERTLINNLNQTKSLTVRFAGQAHERLRSLTISTTDWDLDVSSHVQNLDMPLPNRIRVAFWPWDETGKIRRIQFDLPFYIRPADDPENVERWRCMWLDLDIRDGQVERAETRQMPNQWWCEQ